MLENLKLRPTRFIPIPILQRQIDIQADRVRNQLTLNKIVFPNKIPRGTKRATKHNEKVCICILR
jgi:hypothetical protein